MDEESLGEEEEVEEWIAPEAPAEALPELGRMEYLRLLIEGYAAAGSEAPEELVLEHAVLVAEDKLIREEGRRMQLAEEQRQMEEWEAQKGKRFARAAGWWSKEEQPPWEAVEVVETEEEIAEARRKARNLILAKVQQGFYSQRQTGKSQTLNQQQFPTLRPKEKPGQGLEWRQAFEPLTDEEPF